MRRGHEPCFIGGDDNFLGINLGADFCTEHEMGIGELRARFGILKSEASLQPTLVGIERRQIRRIPGELCYRIGKGDEPDILACVGEHSQAEFLAGRTWTWARELSGRVSDNITAAWSDRDFGVAAYTPYTKQRINDLWEAFHRLDVAFWIGTPPGPTLSRGGLQLTIVSRIPKNQLDTLREADEDVAKLLFAARDTGIEERLKKANKGFFALSPSWAQTHPSIKTRNPVVFWLNPSDQSHNNAGWFSVEQLDQWTRNKGPIPKSKKQQARS